MRIFTVTGHPATARTPMPAIDVAAEDNAAAIAIVAQMANCDASGLKAKES